jgi:hypothetical protein
MIICKYQLSAVAEANVIHWPPHKTTNRRVTDPRRWPAKTLPEKKKTKEMKNKEDW